MSRIPKRQEYNSTYAFEINADKLARLVEVGVSCFKEVNLVCSPNFTVELKSGRHFATSDINEVLNMDNSITNPIKCLTIDFLKQSDSEATLLTDTPYCRVELDDDIYY